MGTTNTESGVYGPSDDRPKNEMGQFMEPYKNKQKTSNMIKN